LPAYEQEFWKTPQDWDNCIHMFRLDVDVGIAYKEDQRQLEKVSYTDPNDLLFPGKGAH
jgi:hypothetical protein